MLAGAAVLADWMRAAPKMQAVLKTRVCSARPVPMSSASGTWMWARPRKWTESGRRTNGGSGTRMQI